MERDSDALRGGYSAQSYIEALTKGLLPHWRRSQLFMQDGAGIDEKHKSLALCDVYWKARESLYEALSGCQDANYARSRESY
jgi:hypothetical protein